jgi:hypothetical protein
LAIHGTIEEKKPNLRKHHIWLQFPSNHKKRITARARTLWSCCSILM